MGCQRGVHHLKDFGASFGCLIDSLLEDIETEPRKFEIELEAGNALVGATELEVHVAEVVLGAENIEQGIVPLDRATVEFGNQSNGNTCYGAGEGDTGVEEGKYPGADAGH